MERRAICSPELTHDGEDDVFMYESLPYSDLSAWILDDGLYREVTNAIPEIWRLDNIKQLSYLTYISPEPEKQYFLHFNHTRLDHTLTVAMVAGEILERNNFPKEIVNKGIIASLLHDIATPAHGDATKNVDPGNLHEETTWFEKLSPNGFALLEKYGISMEAMSSVIRNEGLLGIVLDIADRIGYTMKDVSNCYGLHPPIWWNDPEERMRYFEDFIGVHGVLAENPAIGNIYQEVRVTPDDEVYFEDPKNLYRFLKLRALMHKFLYSHPVSRGRDLLFAQIVKPFYSPDNDSIDPDILTPSRLREMDDYALMGFLQQKYRVLGFSSKLTFQSEVINWYPEVQRVRSDEEAQSCIEALQQHKNIVVMDPVKIRRINTGAHYLTKAADGSIRPLYEVDPEGVSELEAISDEIEGTFVMYKKVDEDTTVNRLLRVAFGKQAA